MSGRSRVFTVEIGNEVGCMDIVPRFPRVVFYVEVFPLYQIPKFPVNHPAVQEIFHYPLFFAINDFWRWRRRDVSAWEGVVCRWCKLDYIEDRMKAAHQQGEVKSVCAVADLPFNQERPQAFVR